MIQSESILVANSLRHRQTVHNACRDLALPRKQSHHAQILMPFRKAVKEVSETLHCLVEVLFLPISSLPISGTCPRSRPTRCPTAQAAGLTSTSLDENHGGETNTPG